jgi:multidrug resistance efflux pump
LKINSACFQSNYEQTIAELKQKIKKLEQDKHHLKETSDLQVPKTARRPNSLSSSGMASAREDAHLLATIRGLKNELAARDKDVIRLNKELDDSKKTNRRLQKEREKALNTNIKCRGK